MCNNIVYKVLKRYRKLKDLIYKKISVRPVCKWSTYFKIGFSDNLQPEFEKFWLTLYDTNQNYILTLTTQTKLFFNLQYVLKKKLFMFTFLQNFNVKKKEKTFKVCYKLIHTC